MSEQRIDTGADAATSTDADPGEGLGAAGPGAAGGDAEMSQPTADRPGGSAGAEPGDTEGESYLRDTLANQRGQSDLGGRKPAAADGPEAGSESGTTDRATGSRSGATDRGTGSGSGTTSGGTASGSGTTGSATRPGGRSATAGSRTDAGEITAEPSERRRREDPGSVAEEFGDRAGTAPSDDVAHPSI
jgi:hypothetical protein